MPVGKDKQILKITVSHPDPKIEKEGAKAVEEFIKAIGQLMGEEVEVIRTQDIKLTNVRNDVEFFETKPFKHGSEDTHFACVEMIEKFGLSVGCCVCNKHDCKD